MDRKNKLNDLLHKVKNLKKDQIMIIFLVGILLMVIAVPTKKSSEEDTVEWASTDNTIEYQDETTYVARLENQLEDVLSQMEGAGDVTVMITLKSSAEQIVEKDTTEDSENVSETDSQGGTRITENSAKEETTVYADGDSQTPYVRKSIMPKVEGVVVIASGGDNSVVVKNITEVIQALFGIESHKIRIVKKN